MLNKKVFMSFCLIVISVLFTACPDFPRQGKFVDSVIDLKSDEFYFAFSDDKTEFTVSNDIDVKYMLKLDSYLNETTNVHIVLYKKNDEGEMEYQNNLSFIMNSGEENTDGFFTVINKDEAGSEEHLKFSVSEIGTYQLKIILYSNGSLNNHNYQDLYGECILPFTVVE